MVPVDEKIERGRIMTVKAELIIYIKSELQKRIKDITEGIKIVIDNRFRKIKQELQEKVGTRLDEVSELKSKVEELQGRIAELVELNNLREREHIS